MESLIESFIKDEHITDRVKFEDYLSVYFNIRPCSFFTIPAELPNASELANKIDSECAENVALILATKDLRLRGELIMDLRSKIRKLFKKYVLKSKVFEAHRFWAKRLNLKMRVEEVRPSIQEVYLYKDSKIGKRLKNLFKTRMSIRRAILQMKPIGLPPSLLVYPEELSSTYVKELGSILGYPECCVNKYAEERSSGIYVEERISNQIRELKLKGKNPDPYAFFSSSFIPCSPTCENASSLGKKFHELLKEKFSDYADKYFKCLEENLNVAENFPKIIAEHRRLVNERAKDLITHM
ncbi:MAG: DUF483 domain-containing protein [Candidatus Verstraetearchaeota archaeon]|nr:DUF483 domain-containing protein [Candidatus Verstraetearchaeota archaeon]